MDPLIRLRHVRALIKLSRKSLLYPECMNLSDISIDGDPFASGSFGDIHKGMFRGEDIAVKVLKIFKTSDMDKLLRVSQFWIILPFSNSSRRTSLLKQ